MDQRSDADFVPSRGRPAARETMSDAHSRQTTVSFGPLQPIFQQGVFDKLLEQRERRAELWRRPNKGPSSAACASPWRQPSPLPMTQMRWLAETVLVPLRWWFQRLHIRRVPSSQSAVLLGVLPFSGCCRRVKTGSRALNRLIPPAGRTPPSWEPFFSTYRQQVAAHTGRTIARRQRHGDSLLQAFRGRQHLGSNLPPVLSAGRRREEPRTYLRLHPHCSPWKYNSVDRGAGSLCVGGWEALSIIQGRWKTLT